MIKLLAISHNTFTQTIRQPIFFVLMLIMFFVLVMTLPLANWAMSTDYHESNQKMLESTGMSTLLVMALLAAAFGASAVLSREIEDKTALTVISKPVSRATFVFGKFLGVGGAILLFYYLGSLVYLMTVRHRVMPAASDPYDWPVIVLGFSALALTLTIAVAGNVLFAWTFTSTVVITLALCLSTAMGLITFVDKGWAIIPFGQGLGSQLLIGLVLLFMAVLIFVAVAITASTRLGQVMTLNVCLAVFVLGSAKASIFGPLADSTVLARPLGWIFPNLEYFYPLDAIAADKTIPLAYVGSTAVYCACFGVGVLAIGAALFQGRQLEAEGTSSSMPGPVGLAAWAVRIGAAVLTIAGLEAILAFFATLWFPSFQSPFLSLLRETFFSGDAADALVLVPAFAYVVLGVLGWLLAGFFGRGAPWSRWVVAVLAAGALIHSALMIAVFRDGATANQPIGLAVRGIVAAILLIVLFLPKTRRHFQTAAG